jgi:hypothetical protein
MSDKQIEVTVHKDGSIVARTINMSGSECLMAPDFVSSIVNGEIVNSYYLESFFVGGENRETHQSVLRQQDGG